VHEARRSVDVQLHNPELTSSFLSSTAWRLVLGDYLIDLLK